MWYSWKRASKICLLYFYKGEKILGLIRSSGNYWPSQGSSQIHSPECNYEVGGPTAADSIAFALESSNNWAPWRPPGGNLPRTPRFSDLVRWTVRATYGFSYRKKSCPESESLSMNQHRTCRRWQDLRNRWCYKHTNFLIYETVLCLAANDMFTRCTCPVTTW